jgi:hypothetical protein
MKKLTIAPVRVSKHQASKKKHSHTHNFSVGELHDSGKYDLGRFGILNHLPLAKRNEIKKKYATIEANKVAEVVPEEIKE